MKRLFALLILSGFVFAQNKVGTSGAVFLKINVVPREAGLGNAYTAVGNDVSSVFLNPGGAAHVKGKALFVSYTNWWLGSKVPAFAFVLSNSRVGNLGFFMSALNLGDFDEIRMDQNGNVEVTGKTFSYNAIQAGITYSKFFTDKFATGVNVKLIHESFGDYTSTTGIAMDAGTYFYTGFKSLRIAMALQNLGPDLRPKGTYQNYVQQGSNIVSSPKKYTAYKLPMTFRLGGAMDVLKTNTATLTIAVDAINPNDNDERFAVGSELNLNNRIFLRAGYDINRDDKGGFGFGFGLNTQKVQLDYSYSNHGLLPDVHRISLSFNFQ